jgi:hypothetical protein
MMADDRRSEFFRGRLRAVLAGGQTFVEYTLLVSLVMALFFTISPLMRRSTQSLVRLVADQVGNQQDSDQSGGKDGYMESSHLQTRSDQRQTLRERLGAFETEYMGSDESISNMVTNLGYSGS